MIGRTDPGGFPVKLQAFYGDRWAGAAELQANGTFTVSRSPEDAYGQPVGERTCKRVRTELAVRKLFVYWGATRITVTYDATDPALRRLQPLPAV